MHRQRVHKVGEVPPVVRATHRAANLLAAQLVATRVEEWARDETCVEVSGVEEEGPAPLEALMVRAADEWAVWRVEEVAAPTRDEGETLAAVAAKVPERPLCWTGRYTPQFWEEAAERARVARPDEARDVGGAVKDLVHIAHVHR